MAIYIPETNKHSSGIAVYTIFLVIMITMSITVALFLFYRWANPSIKEATGITCTFKKMSYCTDWSSNEFGKEPWDWNKKEPVNCHEVGIAKPTSKEECDIL